MNAINHIFFDQPKIKIIIVNMLIEVQVIIKMDCIEPLKCLFFRSFRRRIPFLIFYIYTGALSHSFVYIFYVGNIQTVVSNDTCPFMFLENIDVLLQCISEDWYSICKFNLEVFQYSYIVAAQNSKWLWSCSFPWEFFVCFEE